MKTIQVEIQGTAPLLCNAFTDAAQLSATSGTRSSTVGGKAPPREQAEAKLYLHNGKPCIPQPNLLRCFVDAGKFFKSGKLKVTTQKSSMVSSCLEMVEREAMIKHAEEWSVDSRPVRIPATGGRIIAYRPRFDDWKLTFTLKLDETILSIDLIRDIVDAGGSRIGLGDFRPDTKGPFGRFKVTRWVVTDLAGKRKRQAA